MALLSMDSFDTGNLADYGWVTTATDIEVVEGPYSGYGKAFGRTDPNVVSALVGKTVPGSPNDLIVSLHFKISKDLNSDASIVSIYGADTAWHTYIVFVNATNTIQLWRYSAGTVLGGAPAGSIKRDTWYHLQWHVNIHNSTGTGIVHLNNVPVVNYTGDTDSNSSGTSYRGIIRLEIGRSGLRGGIYVANIVMMDLSGTSHNSFLGESAIAVLRPSGAGSATEMTSSTGDPNWQNVDDLSDVDYNSGVVGQKDLYSFPNVPSDLTVHAVKVNALMHSDVGGLSKGRILTRSGGTNYVGTTETLGLVPAYYSTLYTLDPATSALWTPAGLNAIEAGAEAA